MVKRAIIFDLDNTIYPVASIGDKLFYNLFQLIEKHKGYHGNIYDIKNEIMRHPFQVVAKDFHFNNDLTLLGLQLLEQLTYDESIKPFDDYFLTKNINLVKFLVTSGFTKLQLSKIEQLGIKNDFKEFFIVDPINSNLTKKDVFNKIIEQYDFVAKEVLVVGDDINSEIKAGKELGKDTIVYDYLKVFEDSSTEQIIRNYCELEKYI